MIKQTSNIFSLLPVSSRIDGPLTEFDGHFLKSLKKLRRPFGDAVEFEVELACELWRIIVFDDSEDRPIVKV